ncbi:helicase [Erinaceus europaeus papillomavirus 1]|uniref:Replication protein E1 n=1 Tax=Erinaceus europaeus papillomavirus 1 TaxID=445217 RepID=B7TQN9_9PAPI|nr:helicase [Erinaceus europaeus papillomavirus 1]ACK76236.1 helicase [Erinaceus europaeus papillomavirus 1]
MSVDDKGTDHDWVILRECEDDSIEDDSLENVFSESTDSSFVSGLIDDACISEVEEGNTLALFNSQEQEEGFRQLSVLKRKLIRTPEQLSPCLSAISISPQSKIKKRLFEDSGHYTNETENTPREVDSADNTGVVGHGSQVTSESSLSLVKDLMRSSNRKATALAKFKDTYGVSFTELSRLFKSNKSCCTDWVLSVYGVSTELIEASKQLLQQSCLFIYLYVSGFIALYLLRFKAAKNRDTVLKLITKVLYCKPEQVVADPPKTRSVPAALYWLKTSTGPGWTYGILPEWISNQTLVSQATKDVFDFSQMVQWAYDNDFDEESVIAYNYALFADEDPNARAWLACLGQAKHVKDCATMVRYYKRAEMKEMTMSAWIHKQLQKVETGQWQEIVRFLRYQEVTFIRFLGVLKNVLKGIPKKNCMVLYGPPNTGKSMFAMSLVHCLRGKVISFCNSKSHFWLQPLVDAKLGLLDDATDACWSYIDTYLRGGLDGNPVSIDCKHKSLAQLKFPPLIITTNCDLTADDLYLYLRSRIQLIQFPNPFPFDENGNAGFELSDRSWKAFFKKLWTQLELSDQEDEGEDGEANATFRCAARKIDGDI